MFQSLRKKKYSSRQTAKKQKKNLLTMLLRKDTSERENIKPRMCFEVKKNPLCLRLFYCVEDVK